jgi:hypothetical protein
MVVDRATGRLEQVHITAPNGFLNLNIQFTIRKLFANHGPQVYTEVARNFLGQFQIGGPGEQSKAIVVVQRWESNLRR